MTAIGRVPQHLVGAPGTTSAAPDTAPPDTATYDRLPSLTGLRFVAAFVVFGFHITVSPLFAARTVPGLDFAFRQGATGVSLFFMLSGFVLTWSARPHDTARRFWLRRAAKVFPNHLVTAGVTLAALAVAGMTPPGYTVVSNVLLLQTWIPHETVYFGLNTPSWSLSAEAFFYLCFPLLFPVLRRVPGRWLWPSLAAVLATVEVVPAIAVVLPDSLQYWFVYVAPPVRMLEFVAGILLARIVRTGRWIPLGIKPAVAFAIVGYVGSGYLPGLFAPAAGTALPFALLLPTLATVDLRGDRSMLRAPWLVRLGELSFAFYLVHQMVIRLFEKSLPSRSWPLLTQLGVVPLMLAGALLAAWLLHRAVETPAAAWLTRLRQRGTHQMVTAAVTRPAVTDPAVAVGDRRR